MLLDDIAKLNLFEIEDKISSVEEKDREFYVNLYNKVLQIRWEKYLMVDDKKPHEVDVC